MILKLTHGMEKSSLITHQYMRMIHCFGGFSYREIMDVVITNYGHDITEKQFDKALKEFCKANMIKEIRKAG